MPILRKRRETEMSLSKKLKQKIADGTFREMLREAKWMFRYIKKYRFAVFFYILLGVLGTLMALLSSVAMKRLIDVVTGFETGGIVAAAIYMAGLMLGNVLMQAASSRIAAIINIRVQNGIQAEIYDRMLRTDWESLEKFRSGDLLNRLNTDVGTVASGVTGLLPGLVSGSVQFFGALIIILIYDPIMALIALIGAPLSVICSRFLVRRMRDYNSRMKSIGSEVMSFHEDSFRNLTTIKAFGIMDTFRDKMLDVQSKYRSAYLDYNRFSVLTGMVMAIVGLIISACCFGWGVYRLWTNAISYGTMTMFLQLTAMLRSAFSSIIGLVPTFISVTTSAGRLMAVVELPEEPGARESIDGVTGDCGVELKNVSFTYSDGESPVLEHVDMRIEPGELVALTGASGEGKTTLIRLLLGLVRPGEGKAELILADGRRCEASAATRGAFGYVPQGNTVLAGTIAENLRMAAPEASDEEIIEALKIACAYEFVEAMPQGINSTAGELGRGLSEGQAQRISVARAVLRKAPILLLDEATSALDEETERRMLYNLMNSGIVKSCLIITHRSSTAQLCSRRYVLQGTELREASNV